MARRRGAVSPQPSQTPLGLRESLPLLADSSARQRAEQAVQLRVLGYGYAEIAKRCGYKDPSGARKAVKNLHDKLLIEDVRDATALQAERLERAIQACMEWITEQPPDQRLWGVDRLAPLFKRQAELLGLDAKEAAPSNAPIQIIVPGAEGI